MRLLFAILSLSLIAGCHALTGTLSDEPGSGTQTSPWKGRPIGQLVAVWGKPSRITPVEGGSGEHDWLFSRSYQAAAGFPLIGAGAWRYPFFSHPFGLWGPWTDYYGYEPVELSCEAEARVGPDGLVASTRHFGGYFCARKSPFAKNPPDSTPPEGAPAESTAPESARPGDARKGDGQ